MLERASHEQIANVMTNAQKTLKNRKIRVGLNHNLVFRYKRLLIQVFSGSSRSRKLPLEKCYPILVLKLRTDGIKPNLRPFEG